MSDAFVAAMRVELASLDAGEGLDGSRHKAVSKLLRMYSSAPSRAEKRTPAREGWLVANYPTTLMPPDEMTRAVNAADADAPPLSKNDVAVWASTLKLYRSKAYKTLQGRLAAAASGETTGTPIRSTERRTAAREAYMRENYEIGVASADMLAAMNAMPDGAEMTADDMGSYARFLGLKRPAWFTAKHRFASARSGRREGILSVAAMMERDLMDEQSTCPITLDDALEWGRRNGLRQTLDPETDFARVNEIRRAHSLDLFRLIPPKPRQGPLPGLIHHDARDMR